MEACIRATSKLCKSLGRSIDRLGSKMQGKLSIVEELCPSSRVLKFAQYTPKVSTVQFIAPSASVSGDTEIGEQSTVWYGATIRGDVAPIRIGSNTHICDNVVIHVDSPPNQLPAIIGNNCIIGSDCIVHACTIDDNCLIGEGATVLDGSHICKGAAVAPGSVVTPRKTIPAGELWSGVPARKLRNLTPSEQDEIISMCTAYASEASQHAVETSKDCEQLLVDAADAEDTRTRDITNAYNANPNGVNPHRRGLIYDRLPPEFDDPDETPAVVHRPDAHELKDLSYDVVETDEQDFANLPHLPDHELKLFVCFKQKVIIQVSLL